MQINKHGSFYIRNGWPTKILDSILMDPYIFSPNNELNAVDNIGVGRVMIKAMRYWAVVLGLSEEIKTTQGVSHKLTHLGELVEKFDPYCQSPGTLWLLHRNLVCNRDNATAWYWAFNEMATKSFSKDSFASDFYTYLQKNGEKYTKSAVEKEFDCFKNTYVSDKVFDFEKILDEDTIPFFSPLKLIQYAGEGRYELKRSSPKELPLDIVMYCIVVDNFEHLQNNQQIGIDQLLEATCQIGRYMSLSYASLLEVLQQLENESRITLINNFGNRYIQLTPPDISQLLDGYYQTMER